MARGPRWTRSARGRVQILEGGDTPTTQAQVVVAELKRLSEFCSQLELVILCRSGARVEPPGPRAQPCASLRGFRYRWRMRNSPASGICGKPERSCEVDSVGEDPIC